MPSLVGELTRLNECVEAAAQLETLVEGDLKISQEDVEYLGTQTKNQDREEDGRQNSTEEELNIVENANQLQHNIDANVQYREK